MTILKINVTSFSLLLKTCMNGEPDEFQPAKWIKSRLKRRNKSFYSQIMARELTWRNLRRLGGGIEHQMSSKEKLRYLRISELVIYGWSASSSSEKLRTKSDKCQLAAGLLDLRTSALPSRLVILIKKAENSLEFINPGISHDQLEFEKIKRKS